MKEQRKREIRESLRDIIQCCFRMAKAIELDDRAAEKATLEELSAKLTVIRVVYIDLEDRRGH